MARRAATFVASFLVWCILVYPRIGGAWDWQSILVGLPVAALLALVFSDALAIQPAKFLNPIRWFWLLLYFPVFAYYCIKANLQVMYLVLHPALPIKPGIVKIKTRLKSDTARTALANSITLTPGTMTVDVTDDGYLYIHWLVTTTTDVRRAGEAIIGPFENLLEKIIE